VLVAGLWLTNGSNAFKEPPCIEGGKEKEGKRGGVKGEKVGGGGGGGGVHAHTDHFRTDRFTSWTEVKYDVKRY